jgi:hypothetical protein
MRTHHLCLVGKASLYITNPTLSKISKGPIYLELNFIFFPTLNKYIITH